MTSRTLLPTLLLSLACGGLTPQQFCTETYRASCTRVFQCVTTPEQKAALMLLYRDVADCETKLMAAGNCSLINDSNICNGRGVDAWDGKAAASCIGDIKSQSCQQVFNNPQTCSNNQFCK